MAENYHGTLACIVQQVLELLTSHQIDTPADYPGLLAAKLLAAAQATPPPTPARWYLYYHALGKLQQTFPITVCISPKRKSGNNRKEPSPPNQRRRREACKRAGAAEVPYPQPPDRLSWALGGELLADEHVRTAFVLAQQCGRHQMEPPTTEWATAYSEAMAAIMKTNTHEEVSLAGSSRNTNTLLIHMSCAEALAESLLERERPPCCASQFLCQHLEECLEQLSINEQGRGREELKESLPPSQQGDEGQLGVLARVAAVACLPSVREGQDRAGYARLLAVRQEAERRLSSTVNGSSTSKRIAGWLKLSSALCHMVFYAFHVPESQHALAERAIHYLSEVATAASTTAADAITSESDLCLAIAILTDLVALLPEGDSHTVPLALTAHARLADALTTRALAVAVATAEEANEYQAARGHLAAARLLHWPPRHPANKVILRRHMERAIELAKDRTEVVVECFERLAFDVEAPPLPAFLVGDLDLHMGCLLAVVAQRALPPQSKERQSMLDRLAARHAERALGVRCHPLVAEEVAALLVAHTTVGAPSTDGDGATNASDDFRRVLALAFAANPGLRSAEAHAKYAAIVQHDEPEVALTHWAAAVRLDSSQYAKPFLALVGTLRSRSTPPPPPGIDLLLSELSLPLPAEEERPPAADERCDESPGSSSSG
eukprot:TRINITY_DN8111_c0_g1_i2.p1 TRINITY_DN8111_c0_g1~~TRINITY_DN8111_c0_g1_i2.p1  ORF type:complete len:666 (-),score=116.25 TRINITY_DN8111_c0_g1_i2:51-2048(-)